METMEMQNVEAVVDEYNVPAEVQIQDLGTEEYSEESGSVIPLVIAGAVGIVGGVLGTVGFGKLNAKRKAKKAEKEEFKKFQEAKKAKKAEADIEYLDDGDDAEVPEGSYLGPTTE